MARVKTFANNGPLLPGDLNQIEDDYETAFSTYKLARACAGGITNVSAGTYVLSNEVGDTGAVSGQGANVAGSAAPAYAYAFNVDPADFGVLPRATKFRLRGTILANNSAPGINFTFGVYPVSTWGGAGTTSPYVNGLGSVQAGSTVAINTPSALTPTSGVTSDFTLTAGWYVVAVVLSGGFGTAVAAKAQLQYRQV